MRVPALLAIVALAGSALPALTAEPSTATPYTNTSSEPVAVAADEQAPRLSVERSRTGVYPYRDGYADRAAVDVETNEWVRLTMEYVDSSGRVVKTISRSGQIDQRFWLTARFDSGSMWPAGSYVLRASAADRSGNERVTERTFNVSHKRLVKKVWRKKFTAADVLTEGGVDVGACSTLKRAARSDWRESRGYYSMTRCRRPSDSQVATVNAAWVPKALDGRYGDLIISMYGAGARNGGLRNGRNAYLTFGYYNAAGKFTSQVQFDGRDGEHWGRRVPAASIIRDKRTSPYILWWTGLAGGSRYDVKSFTVRLNITVLR